MNCNYIHIFINIFLQISENHFLSTLFESIYHNLLYQKTVLYQYLLPIHIPHLSIPQLHSCFSCPHDFWLLYYFKQNDLYYKSFQSFDFHLLWLHLTPSPNLFDHIFRYVNRISRGKTLIFRSTTSWYTTSVYVYHIGFNLWRNLTRLIALSSFCS